MIQILSQKLCKGFLLLAITGFPCAQVGLTQQIPTSVAASVARQITVKVQTSDGKLGAGFFIHPCGMILTTYSVIGTTSGGHLVLPDFSNTEFKVVLSRKEEGFAILITERRDDVPKLPKIDFRDYKTLHEAEPLVSRSAVNDGPLCTWLGSVASIDDEFSVIQTIFTPDSRGAPFIDLDGKLVGCLFGQISKPTIRFAGMRDLSKAIEAIKNAPQYDQCFNDAFKDYQFESESLVVGGSGKKVKNIDGFTVESLHDLKLFCWSAYARGQSEIEVNVEQNSKTETLHVSIDKK